MADHASGSFSEFFAPKNFYSIPGATEASCELTLQSAGKPTLSIGNSSFISMNMPSLQHLELTLISAK